MECDWCHKPVVDPVPADHFRFHPACRELYRAWIQALKEACQAEIKKHLPPPN